MRIQYFWIVDDQSGLKRYVASFVPVEMSNPDQDDRKKAVSFFSEFRFISFDDKRIEFQCQYVAIKWRSQFVKQLKENIVTEYPERLLEQMSDLSTLVRDLVDEMNSPLTENEKSEFKEGDIVDLKKECIEKSKSRCIK